MQEYLIEWNIQIDAETPEEAARKALAIQRDPASSATVFKVYDATGEATDVDLEEAAALGTQSSAAHALLVDNERTPAGVRCNAGLGPA